MKKLSIIALTMALLTWSSISQATIVASFGYDDGMVGPPASWDAVNSQLTIIGTQQLLSASASGEFDTTADPAVQLGALNKGASVMPLASRNPSPTTITQSPSITNDTGVAWVGYEISISAINGMPFQISNAAIIAVYPTTTDQTVSNWSISASATDPQDWVVYAVGGTPIQPGGELDMSFQMTFTGSSLGFAETSVAMAAATVPEPGTLVLVFSGLLGLAALQVSRRPRG